MDKPYIIGITGGSGSGKTSFLKALRNYFSEQELCILSLDDYYRPKVEQEIDEQGVTNFDLPKSIDKKAFGEDLRKLMRGEMVTRQEYVFNNDQAAAQMLTFLPAPIIIVEGIFIFHFKKIRKILDLKVFLHAKENLKVIRRIKRDRVERNYPLDDVLYRYEHHVLPTFEKYIQPYIERADVVINNNQSFENGLQVMIGYLKNRLDQLD
ncbi:MAG: P-loop NTPase fold protein [Bacteroidota bacterium]